MNIINNNGLTVNSKNNYLDREEMAKMIDINLYSILTNEEKISFRKIFSLFMDKGDYINSIDKKDIKNLLLTVLYIVKPELNPYGNVVFQIGIGADDVVTDTKEGVVSKTGIAYGLNLLVVGKQIGEILYNKKELPAHVKVRIYSTTSPAIQLNQKDVDKVIKDKTVLFGILGQYRDGLSTKEKENFILDDMIDKSFDFNNQLDNYNDFKKEWTAIPYSIKEKLLNQAKKHVRNTTDEKIYEESSMQYTWCHIIYNNDLHEGVYMDFGSNNEKEVFGNIRRYVRDTKQSPSQHVQVESSIGKNSSPYFINDFDILNQTIYTINNGNIEQVETDRMKDYLANSKTKYINKLESDLIDANDDILSNKIKQELEIYYKKTEEKNKIRNDDLRGANKIFDYLGITI